MRPFLSRILICLLPCLAAAVVVGVAWSNYEEGHSKGLNFKLGVDLAGGTILVYEVDVDKFTDEAAKNKFDSKELVAALKKRIDPGDLKNVTIRPVGKYRVEIILPTGGGAGGNFTAEGVEEVKKLIGQVGSLEFRILANRNDDPAAIEAAMDYFKGLNDPKSSDPVIKGRLAELKRRAERDLPPPPPVNPNATKPEDRYLFPWKTSSGEGQTTYSWVELGRLERESMKLTDKENAGPNHSETWLAAEAGRKENKPVPLPNGVLLYSRPLVYTPTSQLEREKLAGKKFEYFLLVRDPQPGKTIDGRYLIDAAPDTEGAKLAVRFRFNTAGGNLFRDVTTANKPSGSGPGSYHRQLAIMLDGMIESAPTLNAVIGDSGIITGNFTKKQVDDYVRVFKAGALPASLKGQPVSENTMGATLGADTIRQGTTSVLIAFVAILLFMLVYYRFAGVVACVALLANLLMTIGFMVLVQASFTLPGLAGLVLMLGMAVDANVLIYERLREERDRGASLALAIRNGYDRAFPTIIDTHLSSIFTAIVLYAVGNDQLKGFGVSLTAGLIISLFTSLYMTRLLFDIWLAKGWLHKLSMYRLLSKTNIDFMAIRYYWFAATIILTIFGITVFLIRGPAGLNIDFVGGTAYSGQLLKPMDITSLRNLLDVDKPGPRQRLDVTGVEELPDERGPGLFYQIDYADGSKDRVHLRNRAIGETKEDREKDVKKRASELPDLSVEQIFLQSDKEAQSDESRFFTVRTSEKEPELVQVSIYRLLQKDGKSLQKQVNMEVPLAQIKPGDWVPMWTRQGDKDVSNAKLPPDLRVVVLTFSDFASPGHVSDLLRQQFQALEQRQHAKSGDTSEYQLDPQPFDLTGVQQNTDDPDLTKLVEKWSAEAAARAGGTDEDKKKAAKVEQEGRFKLMKVTLSDRTAARVKTPQLLEALMATTTAFNTRPQPERLENFDSQFAVATQKSAFWAIVWSWVVILGYLWFRFGNWTFGLATVACLIHDLFFTLGVIAFCHYIHMWMPGLATTLLLQDFKIDLPSVAALLTLIGYSVNDTIVVFDRIREVRGKNPELTPQMINDSVNQTLSRTLLTAFSVFLVVIVLYIWGGEGVHLFAFVMVVGVIVGTYSSIYIASPLLLIFGEGSRPTTGRESKPAPTPESVTS